MILNKKQEEGIKIAVKRYRDREPFTCIAGFAGSGKSTLVRLIVDALDIDEDRVIYCAYTGKATLVLNRKGCKNTSTLHKLLYKSVPKKNGGFFHIPKTSLDENYKIIVVDEISMVPKEMLELLAKHHVHVICLGDPFQLPPVKDGGNGILQNPHIFLDEIMRQEAGNEIINLSMKIRKQESIGLFKGENVQVLQKKDLNEGMLLWADQILTATNATRIGINNQVRQLLGHGDAPEKGDKVICLKNYWNSINEAGDPMLNGSIGYLGETHEVYSRKTKCNYLHTDFTPDFANELDIIAPEKELFKNIHMDYEYFMTGKESIPYDLSKKLRLKMEELPKLFTYGYAITTWKAQGAEWNKVLVLEEGFPFKKEEHARFIYTAVTRAKDKIVLVQK